jgi:cell division protein FtsW (lipid II flippase)
LPFFSQGGSSLMANLMGLGLLLSIHQHNGQASAIPTNIH